ncbi:HAD-superfamily hydrolase [Cadophora sp. MPI-SDFR-AT-0126]|nr:HAD-superfamily hydrolase [Leotiomycetes sp. MPI-SDFR-AT-0126]
MTKITTILFDCDNTLVLSETLAFEACADLTNDILARQNVSRRFTGPELQAEFVGQSFQDMMKSLATKHDFKTPLSAAALQRYASMEDDLVMVKLGQKLTPCDGANEVLAELVKARKFHLAVVSGSALRRVRLSLEKTGQSGFFDSDEVFSASCSLEVPISKPDPAIYLHAVRALGRVPQECVAVEDSRSGVLAARRAKILVVGYTGCYSDVAEREEMGKVLVEAGCAVVMEHWREFSGCLERIQGMDEEA